jgi:serine/threonine protein kinase
MAQNCPDLDQLLGVLELPEGHPLAVEIEEHVSTCVRCQGLLLTQTGWTEPLTSPSPGSSGVSELRNEAGCKQVLESLRTLSLSAEPSAAVLAPPVPTQLGDYQVLGVIATGGMGLVLHGRPSDGPDVAIKLARPESPTDGLASRFRWEISLMRGLAHPHLVTTLGQGEWDGTPYLVMELLDGLDLGTICRRLGPIPLPEACEVVRQSALALEFMHKQGVVHRDVKPSNLMLARQPAGGCRVKLLDLGLARLVNSPRESGLTVSGQVMGTFDYMAPEQAVSSRRVDERTDVYSLGATLWKLVSGFTLAQEHPRSARTGNPAAVAALPTALVRLVAKITAYDPETRPANPAEVAKLLAPWSRGHDLPALLARAQVSDAPFTEQEARSTKPTPLTDAHTSAHAGSQERMPFWSTSRRRWFLGLAGMGGLAAWGLRSWVAPPSSPDSSLTPSATKPGTINQDPGRVSCSFQSMISSVHLELAGATLSTVLLPESTVSVPVGKFEVQLVMQDQQFDCGAVEFSAVTTSARADADVAGTESSTLLRLNTRGSRLWELFVEDRLLAVGPIGNQNRYVLDWICDQTQGFVYLAVPDAPLMRFDGSTPGARPVNPAIDLLEIIPSQPHPVDEYVDLIAAATPLRELTIHSIPLSEPAIARLTCCHSLRSLPKLSLNSTGVTSQAFAGFRKLQEIQRLNLMSEAMLDDEMLSVVVGFPKLSYLHFVRCGVTGERVNDLSGLRLKHLGICDGPLQPSALPMISRMHSLEHLAMYGTAIDDRSLQHLGRLPRLVELEIGSSRVTNQGLEVVGTLLTLKQLNLSYLPITEQGMKHLQHLKLKALVLEATSIEPEALQWIDPAQLDQLNLQKLPFDDRAVEPLLRFKSLTTLFLRETAISPAGVARLREHLPGCEVVV